MLRIIIIMASLSVFIACKDKTAKTPERNDSIPEPDKELREKNEAEQALKKSGCLFTDPDTSLAGLRLRDERSARKMMNDKDTINHNDQYHFYSSDKKEALTVTQYPGDGNFQLSIFSVQSVEKADMDYRVLAVDAFDTEKGIKLGTGKTQLIEKLGPCYVDSDSTTNTITLQYRIETPNDSKTKLLARQNMPIYYAKYQLRNDKVEKFEFGFEYP